MRTSTDISWKMPENREHEKAGKTVKTEETAKVSVPAGLGEAAGFREAERAESDAAVKKEVKNTVEFYSRRRYTEIRKGAECNAKYQTYF